ncbi:unnamed protein product [Clavelina lepadiformis]|uniref:peptidylprolyl isomerase n=1 Tax=Clavelina lepadiformis TaxID=159417 RepID=A0ABP0GYQ8_CLALP
MQSTRQGLKKLSSFGLCGPTLPLKDGLDMRKIEEGTELEFMTDHLEDELKDMQIESNKIYFEGVDKFSYLFDQDSDDEAEGNSSLSWFERIGLKMRNLTQDGGVRKMIKKEGIGSVVPANCKIRAHYNGYLEDLDEPFDSSRLRNKELQVTLGKSEIVLGLDIGIASMRKEEVARFLIQPSYGYGRMGCPPRIPGNATILFEVELLGFTDSALLDDYQELSEEEKRGLPFQSILEVAKLHNVEGNDFYKRQQYGKATRKYMSTINTLESVTLQNEEQERDVVHICIKAYLNMALCHLKAAHFGKAIAAGKKVLQWEVEHPKALYICGKALHHLGEFKSARTYLMRANATMPSSRDVLKELQILDHDETRWLAAERDMCKKMFERN